MDNFVKIIFDENECAVHFPICVTSLHLNLLSLLSLSPHPFDNTEGMIFNMYVVGTK